MDAPVMPLSPEPVQSFMPPCLSISPSFVAPYVYSRSSILSRQQSSPPECACSASRSVPSFTVRVGPLSLSFRANASTALCIPPRYGRRSVVSPAAPRNARIARAMCDPDDKKLATHPHTDPAPGDAFPYNHSEHEVPRASSQPAKVEVELRDVTLMYGDRCVLDRVNLTIRQGESIALIGPSGTGKSSVLRLISGLALPTSGQVFVRGVHRQHTIKVEPRSLDAAKVAVVFQNPALFDSLSIAENVAFELLERSDLSQSRISELAVAALQRVGLRSDIMSLYPKQLSGGMQKRVSFARAVTYDPDDEDGICRCPELLLLVSRSWR